MGEIPTTRVTLLLRLRDRTDREAWGRFVDLYGPLVYGLARRHGLSDADAADRVQEVLFAVARGLETYDRHRGPFRRWLYSVAMNKLRNFWKSDRKQPHLSDGALAKLSDPVSQPDERWDREYKQRVLGAAMEKVRGEIDPTHWRVFSLF